MICGKCGNKMILWNWYKEKSDFLRNIDPILFELKSEYYTCSSSKCHSRPEKHDRPSFLHSYLFVYMLGFDSHAVLEFFFGINK